MGYHAMHCINILPVRSFLFANFSQKYKIYDEIKIGKKAVQMLSLIERRRKEKILLMVDTESLNRCG